jgi:hypothetical protein
MVIDIETYEAGWSRTISQLDGTLRVDVHAPSRFVFVSRQDLCMRVGVHPGGQQPDAVSIAIDDSEIQMTYTPQNGWVSADGGDQHRKSITIRDGQRVTVRIDAVDKNQRWTYLELEKAQPR